MGETKRQLYITRDIPAPARKMLEEKDFEVTVGTWDRPPTKKEIIKALQKKPYEAVVTFLTDPIDADVFDAAPKAKIVANYAVGYNNIDVDEAKKRGVIVTNTPGNFSHTAGEHTIALMLGLASNVASGDRFVRAKKFRGWSPTLFVGTDLPGKTLGIVGAGRIGTSAAMMAHKGFGMNIVYVDVRKNEGLESECNAQKLENLDELLKVSDFVSLHTPLTKETTHLVTEKQLAMMKKTAYLINTSRGPVIDEKALIQALKEEKIAGAALDVFEDEPYLARGLTRLQNVVLTPHIATATKEAREEMSTIVAENVISFFETGKAKNPVT